MIGDSDLSHHERLILLSTVSRSSTPSGPTSNDNNSNRNQISFHPSLLNLDNVTIISRSELPTNSLEHTIPQLETRDTTTLATTSNHLAEGTNSDSIPESPRNFVDTATMPSARTSDIGASAVHELDATNHGQMRLVAPPVTAGPTLSTDSLLTLLKRVRNCDPNVQWITLERRKIPIPYLAALVNAAADSKYVTKIRLHRVVAAGSSNCTTCPSKNTINNVTNGFATAEYRSASTLRNRDTYQDDDELGGVATVSSTTDFIPNEEVAKQANIEDNVATSSCKNSSATKRKDARTHNYHQEEDYSNDADFSNNADDADDDNYFIEECKVSADNYSTTKSTTNATTAEEECPDRRGAGTVHEFAMAIAHCVRTSISLVDLDISKNDFGNVGCQLLAHAFEEIGTKSPIKRLNLSNNGIGDSGLIAISNVLPQTRVSILKLGNNQFTSEGFHYFCTHVLIQNPVLTNLDLRGNSFGSSTLSSSSFSGRMSFTSILATALQTEQCTLRNLNLNKNNLTDRCVQQIATALETNRSLETLDLQKNPSVTDNGILSLLRCLQTYNDTFLKLKLCSNTKNNQQQKSSQAADYNTKNTVMTKISDPMKQQLLEWLLVNSYGPELARRTKTEYHLIDSYYQPSYKLTMEDNEGDENNVQRSGPSIRFDSQSDETSVLGETIRHAEPITSIVSTTLERECVVCYDRIDEKPPSVVLLPCKHSNICHECATKIQHCHMCRENVVIVYPIPKIVDVPEVHQQQQQLDNRSVIPITGPYWTLPKE